MTAITHLYASRQLQLQLQKELEKKKRDVKSLQTLTNIFFYMDSS